MGTRGSPAVGSGGAAGQCPDELELGSVERQAHARRQPGRDGPELERIAPRLDDAPAGAETVDDAQCILPRVIGDGRRSARTFIDRDVALVVALEAGEGHLVGAGRRVERGVAHLVHRHWHAIADRGDPPTFLVGVHDEPDVAEVGIGLGQVGVEVGQLAFLAEAAHAVVLPVVGDVDRPGRRARLGSDRRRRVTAVVDQPVGTKRRRDSLPYELAFGRMVEPQLLAVVRIQVVGHPVLVAGQRQDREAIHVER